MSLFYILCEIYINNRYTVGVLGRKKEQPVLDCSLP